METETRGPTDLSASVGKEIRKLLIDLDLTQADLAARIGENEIWVSRRLRGSVPIDLNDLARFAAALDKDFLELMPRREGRLIAVGGTDQTSGRKLITATSPLSKRPGPTGPRSPVTRAPSTLRTGRIGSVLAAA
jgi:transcriptional regulator with XRE-family HTH domain